MQVSDGYRKGLIASVKMAQKDLGLDNDVYHELLFNVTGMESAARCSVPQLKAMLGELRQKGWKPRPRAPRDLDPLYAKISAQLHALGLSRSYAEAIIRRQTGGAARLGTASREQLTACIAALTRKQQKEASHGE